MKKRRLKSFVLPTIYILIILVTFFSVSIINNQLLKNVTNYDYSKSLMKDVTQNVLSETIEDNFEKPYLSEKVQVKSGYYSKDYDSEKQTNALISYQSTYMPNSGVLYACDEDFDVITVYDGVVKSIKEDDILGNVIEIMHSENLTTFYYSLKDIVVKEGEEIKKGTIIGKANSNKIVTNQNVLLFEVYEQGKSIDPEVFYNLKPNEIK